MSTTLFRELMKGLRKAFTIGYPSATPRLYSQVPEGLRGKHSIDEEKCIGCGACARRCSSGALKLEDAEGVRRLSVDLEECIFCYRCVEVCPEEALFLSTEFELSHTSAEGQRTRVEWTSELASCANCGALLTAENQLRRIEERVLENIDPSIKGLVEKDLGIYLQYCPKCRRELAYKLSIHPAKYYLR